MTKYCGEIKEMGFVKGGGYVGMGKEKPDGSMTYTVGSKVTIATEISRLQIGDRVFENIRVCVSELVGYIKQGDQACIFVYGHLLRKKMIIGVKSATGPSWMMSPGRFAAMLGAYALFWPILIGIFAILGAVIVGGFFGKDFASMMVRIAIWYSVGISWLSGFRLFRAYREMRAS